MDNQYNDEDGFDGLTQTRAFKIQKELCSNGMDEALFKQMLTDKKFEFDNQDFHFGINFAVYPEDGNSSICYTDTKNRAELVTYALNNVGDLIEENTILKSALKQCLGVDCGNSDCRAVSGQINHSYCKYHMNIVTALEDLK